MIVAFCLILYSNAIGLVKNNMRTVYITCLIEIAGSPGLAFF